MTQKNMFWDSISVLLFYANHNNPSETGKTVISSVTDCDVMQGEIKTQLADII